ncbi:MAG: hypothetical protein SVM80_07780 [Halobacteriota archaeon]|nr:hypothetical protein [Halobacteriota archaeon]
MSFAQVAWLLWIPALIIGWYVVSSGITISNIFYGLGSFTAIVTILYVLSEGEIPSWAKVIVLFVIAFVAIGMGYYISEGRETDEEEELDQEDNR